MTAVVISQPMYFPWLGFFELASMADVFIHLDDVQFSKGSFTNRVQVKHPSGIKWMSVALAGKGTHCRISDLKPHDPFWSIDHRRLLDECFADAPFRAEAVDLFNRVVDNDRLPIVLRRSIDLVADSLGIFKGVRRLVASEMGVGGCSWRRVLDLVHSAGGTRYITAHGAANYLDHEAFEREGVSVEYVDYVLRPWPQRHGAFTPYVSVLDVIANCGPEAAAHVCARTLPWRAHLQKRDACG